MVNFVVDVGFNSLSHLLLALHLVLSLRNVLWVLLHAAHDFRDQGWLHFVEVTCLFMCHSLHQNWVTNLFQAIGWQITEGESFSNISHSKVICSKTLVRFDALSSIPRVTLLNECVDPLLRDWTVWEPPLVFLFLFESLSGYHLSDGSGHFTIGLKLTWTECEVFHTKLVIIQLLEALRLKERHCYLIVFFFFVLYKLLVLLEVFIEAVDTRVDLTLFEHMILLIICGENPGPVSFVSGICPIALLWQIIIYGAMRQIG